MEITSPLDEATINRARTIVRGTFKADTNDVGIRVNGAIAEIFGDEWVANGVPLSVGQNRIEAVITGPGGNTATDEITVNTENAAQAVTLSANVISGLSPLEVYFSVDTAMPYPIASYQMDFEGDNGVVDYSGATFEDISHTYTAEGFYYPTVKVTDSEGNSHSDTVAKTGDPIKGAVVVAVWNECTPSISGSDCWVGDVKEDLTDEEGKWMLRGPKGDSLIGMILSFIPFVSYTESPTFIVFKPGYCPYPRGSWSIKACESMYVTDSYCDIIGCGDTVGLPKLTEREDRRRASMVGPIYGSDTKEKEKELLEKQKEFMRLLEEEDKYLWPE